jgi:hypothetical protein
MIGHFFLNMYMALMAMVFMTDKSLIASSSLNQLLWQVFKAAYALAGLPIIVMAFWGSVQRVETLVRCYFWYGVLSVCLDMIFIVNEYVLSSPCDHLPPMLQGQGKAAACGAARGINTMFVLLITGIQMYMVYVLWSYCEDLYEGGGLEIGDLAKDIMGRPLSQQVIRKRLVEEDPATSLMGLRDNHQKPPGFCGQCMDYLCCCCGTGMGEQLGFDGGYSTMMEGDAPAGFGLAGRRGIFNGWYHEMAYPPPSQLMKNV